MCLSLSRRRRSLPGTVPSTTKATTASTHVASEATVTDNLKTFQAWPKIPRLFRRFIITEKIDGTNAAVVVTEDGEVLAQSRTRFITPDSDNFGFAAWVKEHE